jgi:protein ImuB
LPDQAQDHDSRRRSLGPETPLVLAERGDNHWLIAAANPAAEALGIRPGQGLADARACLPALVAEPMDRAADEADLCRLADWATRFSPAVAIEGEDGLTLDITGCAHLWPGETGLLADLKARLARFKLHGRSAVADTIGAAWALARYGPPDAIQKTSQPAEALADLPPAALRLPEPLAAQLERLGLRRIADLAVLPRAALASRFGEAMVQRLDRTLARAPSAFISSAPASRHGHWTSQRSSISRRS